MKEVVAPRYSVAAVDRVAAILDAVDGKGGRTLTEIARAANLSDATALRYLASCVRNDLVERDPENGRYRLGLRMFQLGQRALGDRDPRKAALPFMERLLERFEETVNLAMRNRDDLVLVEVLESTRSIKKGASVGDRDVWHSSALGKAILAFLPPEERAEILGRCGFEGFTAATRRSLEELQPDLERVHELGYAIDEEESEEGLRCVAAPIFDGRDRPSIALSVSGPANRVSPALMLDLGREISSAAASISMRLGCTRSSSKEEDSGRRI
jgi:DNA-binding IclR family transcriptional regulator